MAPRRARASRHHAGTSPESVRCPLASSPMLKSASATFPLLDCENSPALSVCLSKLSPRGLEAEPQAKLYCPRSVRLHSSRD